MSVTTSERPHSNSSPPKRPQISLSDSVSIKGRGYSYLFIGIKLRFTFVVDTELQGGYTVSKGILHSCYLLRFACVGMKIFCWTIRSSSHKFACVGHMDAVKLWIVKVLKPGSCGLFLCTWVFVTGSNRSLLGIDLRIFHRITKMTFSRSYIKCRCMALA